MDKIKKIIKQIFGSHENKMTNIEFARSIGVKIGENCRIFIRDFGSEPYLISIGDHVTVANGVKFVTHDGGLWVLREKFPDIDFIRPIIIYDNCFIGINSILMPGITVGPNSVIGAGSIVTRSVPPNCIAIGIPAKVTGSIEDYKRKVSNTLPTSQLTIDEKKKFYLNYFGRTKDEWLMKMDEISQKDG